MNDQDWRVEGDYVESCNCAFLCPCISSNMTASPTTGECKVAMVFHTTKGHHGATSLDDLSFAVAAWTPGAMIEGNWTVGIIIDDRANDAQRDAIAAIASGKAGGPMAALEPLIGTFAGVESTPIQFEKDGLGRHVAIPGALEQGVAGMPAWPIRPSRLRSTRRRIRPTRALLWPKLPTVICMRSGSTGMTTAVATTVTSRRSAGSRRKTRAAVGDAAEGARFDGRSGRVDLGRRRFPRQLADSADRTTRILLLTLNFPT